MADHRGAERIRRGLGMLMEDAPLAPNFDELITTHARPVEPRKAQPLAVALLSAAAVTATFFMGAIWLSGPNQPSELAGQPPVAAPDTQSAPGEFPRILLQEPGWTVVYVDHSEGDNEDGEFEAADLRFSNGSAEVELRMASGSFADLDALIADRQNSNDSLEDQAIWDTNAVLVGNSGSSFIAMWESNAVEYELVAHDTDEATFRSLLNSLTVTSYETWLASLSEEIITDRRTAVSRYLADVPLPPSFDTTVLEAGPVEHWYHVAAEAVSAVSCAWIDSWIDATSAGDTETAQLAVEAMASSRDWQVLTDMTAEGEFSTVIWEYADAMAGDGTIEAGISTTVEASYGRALGCGT